MNPVVPGLFGLQRSNRDFKHKEAWGKNQFNSSFPAALCNYLFSRHLAANYLYCQNQTIQHQPLPIDQAFLISPTHPDIYFAFEAQHSPYQRFVIGSLPRTDLVIQNLRHGDCLTGLEN